jgi:hypothetical protein
MIRSRAFRFSEYSSSIATIVIAILFLVVLNELENDNLFKIWGEPIAYSVIAGVIIHFVYSDIILRIFNYHAQEVVQHVNMTTIWQELGIMQMTPNWKNCLNPSQEGTEFRDHLGVLPQVEMEFCPDGISHIDYPKRRQNHE